MFQISLRAARVNAELTQEAAARGIGVDKATIVSWEKGKTSPRVEHLQALCNLYQISINNIFLPRGLLKENFRA